MAKIYKINPEKFALACVQSSASNLKVADKLGLYKAAYDEAKKLKDESDAEAKETGEKSSEETRKEIQKFFNA